MSAREPTFRRDREPEYLDFDGTATRSAGRISLRPAEDERIVLFFRPSDVIIRGSRVGIRVGARALAIDVPRRSSVPVSDRPAIHPRCRGGTMCLGRIEFCCADRKMVGACGGSWRCR